MTFEELNPEQQQLVAFAMYLAARLADNGRIELETQGQPTAAFKLNEVAAVFSGLAASSLLESDFEVDAKLLMEFLTAIESDRLDEYLFITEVDVSLGKLSFQPKEVLQLIRDLSKALTPELYGLNEDIIKDFVEFVGIVRAVKHSIEKGVVRQYNTYMNIGFGMLMGGGHGQGGPDLEGRGPFSA